MWQHNNLDEVRRGLLAKNIIEISGDVDRDMVMYVREAVLRLTANGSPAITVMITSSGGSVSCGLDIYDILSFYSGEKTGIVQGFAESMAAVILQSCQKRKSMRHSGILIHHVSRMHTSLDVLRHKKKLAKATEELEGNQSRLYAILAHRTKHTIQEVRRECAKNQSMKAEEALAFGLIDEII